MLFQPELASDPEGTPGDATPSDLMGSVALAGTVDFHVPLGSGTAVLNAAVLACWWLARRTGESKGGISAASGTACADGDFAAATNSWEPFWGVS